MNKKRWMTIFFTDGSKLRFNFSRQEDDASNIGTKIKEGMNQNQLILEVEGVLFTIPFVNIKYIQAYPCPDKLPDTAIRGVKLIDEL